MKYIWVFFLPIIRFLMFYFFPLFGPPFHENGTIAKAEMRVSKGDKKKKKITELLRTRIHYVRAEWSTWVAHIKLL